MRDRKPEWRFLGFEIESPDVDALPSDPIMKEGEIIGYVTSAAFGYRTGKRLALGYIRNGSGAPGDRFDIEILGRPCSALGRSPHAYDSNNLRLKG